MITLTGFLIDGSTGEPLPGANIYIANTNPLRGTTTAANGAYILYGNPGETVVFRYLGFKERAIKVDNLAGAQMEVELEPTSEKLDEATVFPGKKKTNWLGWGAGIATLLLLATTVRKKDFEKAAAKAVKK